MTKVMICAGEASGDLHGASVADDLKTLDPQIELLGMGGSHMRTAGVDIVYDIADIGVMGFVEILWNLPKFFHLRDYLSKVMDARRPDVVLLIDYGGRSDRRDRCLYPPWWSAGAGRRYGGKISQTAAGYAI